MAPGVLPAEITSFVGREAQLAELSQALTKSRIVTVTGVGGVGKSRLALRIALEAEDTLPDGAWLVDLAGLQDPGLLAHAVAEAAGVQDQTVRSLDAVVADYLADKDALLVLDTCDHLLGACARLTGALLKAAPRLRILAGSRQPFGIPGEYVIVVPPLGESEAVDLFLDRAGAAVQGFALSERNAPTINRLCRRLDGIPLAIELAAVRLRSLTPQQLLKGLDDRFQLLVGDEAPTPTVGGRHQTLRRTVGWSHELCTPTERLLWARLSVFAGAFTAEAAQSICAGGPLDDGDILGCLAGLIDRSIVLREDAGSTVRYRLLDTICDYGREWLRGLGEEHAVLRRHRDWYQSLVARAEAEWLSPAQERWSATLRREQADIRAALEFSLDQPDEGTKALRMSAALWTFWISSGRVREGRRWTERALEASVGEATPTRARALWVAGWLATVQGDHTAAASWLTECRSLAEALGYGSALASSQQCMALLAMFQGDYDRALALFEEALHRHRSIGDPVGVITLLTQLALCYGLRGDQGQGDLDRALALCEECLRRSHNAGEHWCRASAFYASALAHWKLGRRNEAERLAHKCLRLGHDLEDRLGVGVALELLVWTAAEVGRFEHAAVLFGAAAAIWRSTGAQLLGVAQLRGYSTRATHEIGEALGAAAFDTATGRGQKMDMREAIAYAADHEQDISTCTEQPGSPG